MSQLRIAHLGLLAALLGFNLAPGVVGGLSAAYAAESTTLRPEVGKPLQAATDDIKKGKYKEALAKIHDAEAVGGRTSYENYMIDYMRASAAQGAGDHALATKSYEAVLASGHVSGAAQSKIVQVLATMYYQAGDYPKAITWLTRYISEGGDDAGTRMLLTQSYYNSGDYARASKETLAAVQAEEKAGRVPSEEQLDLLANCAFKMKDKAGEAAAMEKMVVFHPTKATWIKLLNRLEAKSGFNESRLGLDVYRLKLAIGAVNSTADFTNMTELALQAGYPAEAVKIIDMAYKTGAFGSGDQASRQKRLQAMAMKNAAADQKDLPDAEAKALKADKGDDLAVIGYNYVTMGQVDKGISLLEKSLEKGVVAHPNETKLHLGIAYLQADKKAKAMQVLKTVHDNAGVTELAHYWSVEASHPVTN